MHYNYLNKRNILLFRSINENVDEELEAVEKELYLRNKPQVYAGEEGLLAKMDNNFEDSCIILQQNGITDPKKKSIYVFYRAIELIKKQHPKDGKSKKYKNA